MPVDPSTMIPPEAIFTVSEFLDFINHILKPLRVTVQGEITSLKVRSGHIYFSISDQQEKAKLDCIIWKFRARSLSFDLEEGAEVKIVGTPNMYKPFGKFSFIADHISPVGEGALRQAFEKLKLRLEEAGYFSADRKQVLPSYPQKIGLITSSRGDAIKDFQTHLGNFGLQLLHYDVTVEGINAIDSIVQAIEWFNAQPQGVEVLVLTRGGGSLESLQAFNSEPVAKAIYASKIPVLSAIGHENDITIADLVADQRGSTPTDAGKILSTGWREAAGVLDQTQQFLLQTIQAAIINNQQQLRYHQYHVFSRAEQLLNFYVNRLDIVEQLFMRIIMQQIASFEKSISSWQQNFVLWQHHWQSWQHKQQQQAEQLVSTFSNLMQQKSELLRQYNLQLKISDPRQKLRQGYSIARLNGGELVRLTRQVNPADSLQVQVYDGKIETTVAKVQHE